MDFPDPNEKVPFRDHTFDRRMACALKVLEERLGYELTILQGSYSTAVGASAGTHAGGGAADLTSYDWRRKVIEGSKIGLAIYRRKAIPGVWVEHVHCTLVGDPECSDAAKQQNKEYMAGGDGLVGDNPDPHADLRPDPKPIFNYREYWVDKMLDKKIKGVKAKIKTLRDRLEKLRRRRRALNH